MKQQRLVMIVGVVSIALGGCAGGASPKQSVVGYDWVAGSRAAEKSFSKNNESCTQVASLSGYESCMTAKGYQRYGQ